MYYVTVTLMTFDKQSNGRRIEVISLLVRRNNADLATPDKKTGKLI